MRYTFLRTASCIIIGIGAVIGALSLIVGLIALVSRPETNDGLMVAGITIGGVTVGILIAAGGQLLQVFIDMSDILQKIDEHTADLVARLPLQPASDAAAPMARESVYELR